VFEVRGTVEPALEMCEDSRCDQCGGVIACCTSSTHVSATTFFIASACSSRNGCCAAMPNMQPKPDSAEAYRAPRWTARSSSVWVLYHGGSCIMSVPGARYTRRYRIVEVGEGDFGASGSLSRSRPYPMTHQRSAVERLSHTNAASHIIGL
jgi:hypothetical protein